jgi:hypothetical protein
MTLLFSTGLHFVPGHRLHDGNDLNIIVDWVNHTNWVPSFQVTMVQMRKALVSTGGGAIYKVQNGISADIADSINIQWAVGNVVDPGDALARSIQTSLGYTDSQMISLFALARTM